MSGGLQAWITSKPCLSRTFQASVNSQNSDLAYSSA